MNNPQLADSMMHVHNMISFISVPPQAALLAASLHKNTRLLFPPNYL